MISSREPALLLTGGGARAAYQVGVLKGIAAMVPRAHPLPFRILCGTSAGAINATALACYASNFRLSVKRLEHVWSNFTTEQVYQCSNSAIFGQLFSRIGHLFQQDSVRRNSPSLFNNQPLRELLSEVIDFKRIDRHIHNGHLRAVSVTASSYSTGESVSFFEGIPQYENWLRAKRRGTRVRLNTEHLMASSAIPLLFPATRVNQTYYGDGSIHQMAPLSAPVHLGASKILVIGLEQPQIESKTISTEPPSGGAIAGHLLDTIFADTLNSDLERLERVNKTTHQLEQAGVPHETLRRIDSQLIHSAHDFNEIAHRHYKRMPKAVRRVLSILGVSRDTPSSLISYLLFEKEYCRELIELGYQDAMKQSEEIHPFLELGGKPVE
ncbi:MULTISPECIES: patatin-like phospholipase family protein [Gammaproteobacteria]|uniref:patatin-like phospholipase family protein n=1 Tax=Gammaproteobacteria TaxID=1236 RepID=UPI000DCFA7C4|nr:MULTISPECIES: patatin-like phospholipase family protein [Gammaproteobacteria]RTE87509.1 patatin-like phospholipase family protein [Aliidiomarina sp. B3213]TCZ92706.1 patatin-like phospholipase family protein [Lysobacter sp. N42]